MTTVTTMAGNGLLFSTDQGYADDREKSNDTKNQGAIHISASSSEEIGMGT